MAVTEVISNGGPTGIWSEDVNDTARTKVTYLLPVSTMAFPRTVRVDFNNVVAAGAFANTLLKSKGVKAVAFASKTLPGDKPKDLLTVEFNSPQDKAEHRAAMDARLASFVRLVQSDLAKRSYSMFELVNPLLLVQDEDFLKVSERLAPEYNARGDEDLVAIDSVLEVFNHARTRRHGGEISRVAYNAKDRILTVKLSGACNHNGELCAGSKITVERDLQGMYTKIAPGYVNNLVITV